MTKQDYFYGLGRRKASTASARVFGGKGTVTINKKPALDYFCQNQTMASAILAPLMLIGKDNAYDITILVRGGGLAGQVDACTLAISKAVAGMNDDLRAMLKKGGLLKRDPREKESKKYGLRSARKREQFSKR